MPKHRAKVGIISQARTGSSRLPSKILLKSKGKTVLGHHIDRLLMSGRAVIVATSNLKRDDPIINITKEHGALHYRGSESDVLDRYYSAAKEYKLDIIVRVTSDCPLIDGRLIGQAIESYLNKDDKNLYLSNMVERTYPRGFDFEIFSFDMLEEAWNSASHSDDREHVTLWIRKNELGRYHLEHVKNHSDLSRFRVTLDTEADWKLLDILIKDYGAESLHADEINSLLIQHPELVKINEHIEQKKVGNKSY